MDTLHAWIFERGYRNITQVGTVLPLLSPQELINVDGTPLYVHAASGTSTTVRPWLACVHNVIWAILP